MFKKLLVFFEKLAGKTMFWAGIELSKKGKPTWQLKVMTGIERKSLLDNQEKKRKQTIV